MRAMTRIAFGLLCGGGLLLAACGPASNTNTNQAPANNAPAGNTAAPDPAPVPEPAKPLGQDELALKAWDYLKTMYNVPAKPDDRAGINSGWGPKSMNIPYTAMVLHGLHGTKAWDSNNEMIKDSVAFLVENQEAAGSFSYMPVSVMPQAKGLRAVYITSIVAQLFVDLNREGPWKGKLTDNIAKARDYLKQSQVGHPEGPAPEYDKGKAGFGGWAYSKEEIGKSVGKDGKPPANMSTSTYAIDALKACGLDPKDPLWEKALVFLKRNQNAGEVQEEGFEAIDKASGKKIKPAAKGSADYGGAIYSEESSMVEGGQQNEDGTITLFSYGSMTYNLLRGYLFAGLSKDSLPVKLAYGWIQRNYTVKRVPGFRDEKTFEMGLYYYYASMARTLNAWGSDHVEEPERGTKHDWRADLVAELKSRQKENGSWVNDKHNRWQENSPVLCTAYALDALKHTRK
ncbi:MAG: hypothetical protein HS108_14985 [Planctomycetes bacterium]|nr:hypothetical protein [Planctomycetota bacterium]MCL4729612.1 hypothetical protein [Planctomycetota bacterium]